MAVVAIERLPALCNHEQTKDSEGLVDTGYNTDCVALTRDYGRESWEVRPEVAAIRTAVFAALDRLEAESTISSRFSGRPVLVKPNLVTVYHNMGLQRRSYPETTDPRVLDAVVLWLQRYSSSISIVESSGRGVPTRGSFRVSGIDRLAKHRGCRLVALDETPVDRYILPKASFHREILVPELFSAVVRGEAAYVSVPKLKTNLYTDVTLGFKNAMGVIPYNLRQRSHHYAIDRKLVEMLYLFKPDMIVIDGVVGAEGECPAPVDPVDSRVIIAGDHPVETDRVATELMGFDASSVKLIREADALGFGDPAGARVLTGGTAEEKDSMPVFRPVDWMLTSDRVTERFPRIKVLIGIDRGSLTSENGKDLVVEMQESCRGGCVATTRFALSMFEAEGLEPRRPVVLIIGGGVKRGGVPYWYDAEGKAYSEEDIRRLPGKKAVIGSCSRPLAPISDRFVEGCMVLPNAPHMVLHTLSGTTCTVMSLRNRNLLPLLAAILGQRSARRLLIKTGKRIDAPLALEDRLAETRPLTEEEAKRNWVAWPLPPIDPKEKKELLAFEDDAAVASFRGVLLFRLKERLLWRIKAVIAALLTMGPLVLALVSAVGGTSILGIKGPLWLLFFAVIEGIHILELPAALKAGKEHALRKGKPWTMGASLRSAVAALCCGYPSWVPKKRGVFG
ncbi:MAG: DUF362 domain-containing protein [Spirochaetales bacterium]|nr:DUF362 domain-containing protein [Spirochaetales bacterium]